METALVLNHGNAERGTRHRERSPKTCDEIQCAHASAKLGVFYPLAQYLKDQYVVFYGKPVR